MGEQGAWEAQNDAPIARLTIVSQLQVVYPGVGFVDAPRDNERNKHSLQWNLHLSGYVFCTADIDN